MRRKVLGFMLILSLLLVSLLTGCARNNSDGGRRGASANNGPLDCNWVLHVDQTIPVTKDNLTVEYTLVLIAEKQGGKDVMGTYEGAAYLGMKTDISHFSQQSVEFSGGFDLHAFADNLSFDLVGYNVGEYTRFGAKEDEVSIPPLVKYEAMALISPEMTGAGIVNPRGQDSEYGIDLGYEGTVNDTVPIPMKIVVLSGQVRVDIPVLNIYRSFEGLLLGDPVEAADKYQTALNKIEELKAESESESEGETEGGLGDLGGFGGIMGKMGTNLEVPESFPQDLLPLMPGANVINVYESESKKNIRVMYASDKDCDEILAFYEEAFLNDHESSPLDIDDGYMFMCEAEGYRNVSIMIMKDLSKTYNSLVSLEVLKE